MVFTFLYRRIGSYRRRTWRVRAACLADALLTVPARRGPWTLEGLC